MKIKSKSVIRRLSYQFSFSQIVKNFHDEKLSLFETVQILDYLGFTVQERRKIISGIIRAKELENK